MHSNFMHEGAVDSILSFLKRRVIMAISSTTHQGHPERLGTSTEQ
jgi:hypothetical protein